MAPSACLTGCLIVLATFSLAGGVFAATNSISTNVNDTTISTEGVFSGPFVPNIQCSKECSGPPELPPSLLDAAAHLTNICANMTILYNLVHPHERLFEPPNIYANQWSCVPANISSGLPNPNCSLDCPAGTYCGLGYFGYWGPYENRSILVEISYDACWPSKMSSSDMLPNASPEPTQSTSGALLTNGPQISVATASPALAPPKSTLASTAVTIYAAAMTIFVACLTAVAACHIAVE